ncbi:hypothetical protein N9Y67_04100 [Pseudomonadota bacterium]|nr:hypothetical protein [Pseudomonadota bacterium]
MKSLVFIVLLVVAAIAGYSIINKPTETVAVVDSAVEEVTDNTVEPAQAMDAAAESAESEEVNLITPADMTEKAQEEMYSNIMEYNKCMMQNRLEYHQQGMRAESVADKTLTACEPHLDDLKLTLETNNVNKDLSEGMVKTMRQRMARKLMSNVMQSLARQAAADNSVPVAAPITP